MNTMKSISRYKKVVFAFLGGCVLLAGFLGLLSFGCLGMIGGFAVVGLLASLICRYMPSMA